MQDENIRYVEIEQLAEKETKTKAEFARDILRDYVNRNKKWQEIRNWGKESSIKYNVKSDKDIESLIHETRGVETDELI